MKKLTRSEDIACIYSFNDDFVQEAFEHMLVNELPQGRSNIHDEQAPMVCSWYHAVPTDKGHCTTIFTSHRNTWFPGEYDPVSKSTISEVAYGEYMGEPGTFTLHRHNTSAKAPYER